MSSRRGFGGGYALRKPHRRGGLRRSFGGVEQAEEDGVHDKPTRPAATERFVAERAEGAGRDGDFNVADTDVVRSAVVWEGAREEGTERRAVGNRVHFRCLGRRCAGLRVHRFLLCFRTHYERYKKNG